MSRLYRSAGFTLVELLIVVAIIGILAAIAIPQMSLYRAKAYCASMQADLANWNIAQEAFYTTNGAYSPNAALNDPPGFKPSPGVVFNVTFTNTLGYGATITHPLCVDNLGNQITYTYDSTRGGLQ